MVGILTDVSYGLKRSLSAMYGSCEAAAHEDVRAESKKHVLQNPAGEVRVVSRLRRHPRALEDDYEAGLDVAPAVEAVAAVVVAAAAAQEETHREGRPPASAAETRLAAVLEGSIALARSQLSNTACSAACGVCGRDLGAEELALCLAMLAKRVAALSRRSSSSRSEVAASAAFTSCLYERQWKLSFHASLKQIKLAIITKRRCPACRHAFNTADLGRALSFIDRNLESACTPSCRAHSACML
jgi:hypothetical protein